MKTPSVPFRFLAWMVLLSATIPLHNSAAQGPEQAFQRAMDLQNQGKIEEAAAELGRILKDYPTATVVPDAQFRLGYLSFVLGDYNRALETLDRITGPPAPPQIQEAAQALHPQALAAKAGNLPADDPNRNSLFEEALKEFAAFLQNHPQSGQAESINYGRALTLYYLARYDEATEILRSNLTHYPQSESIADSQYLLALTLATKANKLLQEPGEKPSPIALVAYDEAEKLLQDLIRKGTDVALANDARYQLGEIRLSRALSSPEDQKASLLREAMNAFREVQPKDRMVAAQQARLENIVDRIREAGQAKDTPLLLNLQRLQDREQIKLAKIEARPDQTISAQIKVAEIFFQLGRYDETRVLLNHLSRFAEGEDQKESILYYRTLSYALQNLIDKAVQSYTEFAGKYPKSSLGENLPLVMGAMFLKANQVDRAIDSFDKGLELYPNGRFTAETLVQKAAALIALRKFDEARQALQKILAGKPRRDIAAAAEFALATIEKDLGEITAALASFKEVQQKYAGTPQATRSAYWIAQMTFQKGDLESSIDLFKQFIARHSESELAPAAVYGLGQAQLKSGDTEAALETFEDVAEKFPGSEAAASSYFQRGTIYSSAQDTGKIVEVMEEFIRKYPDSENLFFAYDAIGQTQVNSGDLETAIATYQRMVDEHPGNPQTPQALLKIAELWLQIAQGQGRYLALNEEQRAKWEAALEKSMTAAESLLEKFPESAQVSLALQSLIENQRLMVQAGKKTPADAEQYFRNLADKFADKPGTRSKVLFALAAYLWDSDKNRALELMEEAYDSALLYAPADIDLYANALIEKGQLDKAGEVYRKLLQDYPNRPGTDPQQAPLQIMEAQAMALYGQARILQEKKDVAGAAKLFERLKALYPWSPKIVEANYGIAQSRFEEKKYDEALRIAIGILQAPLATADVRANAMLLGARIQEAQGHLEAAIDYYGKVATFYEGVPSAAAESLWKAGELIEKQVGTLADATRKKTQMQKAIRYYRELTRKYPTSPFTPKAKERLAALGNP